MKMQLARRNSPRSCGLTYRDLVKLAANLVLPLTLGIFTAVITLHQQNVTSKQRLEDRQLATEQRMQDLNISRLQRLEDRQLAREQREQDLNISHEQREQDKQIAKLQRDQEIKLAEEKLAHDKMLAEEKLRDELFAKYMNDIIQLLKETNGSLTNDPMTAFIVRVKTLTIIRQLDPIRNTHLIRFLYDANQLTNGANPIDLSDAELDGINMSMASTFRQEIHNLSLVGAYLRNSSFSKLDLFNSNFSRSRLDHANFALSILSDADFSDAVIVHADLSSTQIFRSRFNRVHGRRVNFFEAYANNTRFTNANLILAKFTRCTCQSADFDNAHLEKTEFDFAQLKYSTFIGAKLIRTIFSNSNLESANLSKSRMTAAEFSSAKCEQATFVRAIIQECSFIGTNTKYTDMSYADLKDSRFNGASLFAAMLPYANLINVNFDGTDFRQANLSYTKFGHFNESQLNSAISIRGAQLSNKSIIARDRNLINNGDAHCNLSIERYWSIKPKNSVSVHSDEHKSDNCVFVSSTTAGSIMSQNVSLTAFIEFNRNRQLIAVMTLLCAGHDNQTSVHITDINGNKTFVTVNTRKFVEYSNLASTLIIIRFPVIDNYRFVVNVIFGPKTNNNWCDDITFNLESTTKD